MKAGFIALIGFPNVGKSTLVNAVVGEKVSIVSPKPQTTRRRITGILSEEGLQAIFVDAPGVLFKSKSRLNEFLLEEYNDVLANSDAALAVLSYEDSVEESSRVLDLIKESGLKFSVILNKSDLGDPEKEAAFVKMAKAAGAKSLISLSALKDQGLTKQAVTETVKALLPDSEAPLYDPELYTTETIRDIAGEVVREKCFHSLEQELPYNLAVRVNSFVEENRLVKIQADILVAKDNHKGIVIGRGGAKLKGIGSSARKELEKLLGQKVFLELYIKVKPDWFKNRGMMKELGYVIDKR